MDLDQHSWAIWGTVGDTVGGFSNLATMAFNLVTMCFVILGFRLAKTEASRWREEHRSEVRAGAALALWEATWRIEFCAQMGFRQLNGLVRIQQIAPHLEDLLTANQAMRNPLARADLVLTEAELKPVKDLLDLVPPAIALLREGSNANVDIRDGLSKRMSDALKLAQEKLRVLATAAL